MGMLLCQRSVVKRFGGTPLYKHVLFCTVLLSRTLLGCPSALESVSLASMMASCGWLWHSGLLWVCFPTLVAMFSAQLARDCHGLLYPAGYSRVRVRVGFLQPGPYPYPQPGVGGSAHTFKLRAKSTQTTPDASFGPYVGMFSSFFSCFFPN